MPNTQPPNPFNRLAVSVGFSPTGEALLCEARRLQQLWDSDMIFIHAGERNPRDEERLLELIQRAGFSPGDGKLVYRDGDPAKVILKCCEQEHVDLLIAGALEKEKFLKYYTGSVARTIMRNAPCSSLIIVAPKKKPVGYKKIYASIDYLAADEYTAQKAFQFAASEKAEELCFLHEFTIPGLSVTVTDSGDLEDTELLREEAIEEERSKIRLFVNEQNISGHNMCCVALYGKEGWAAAKYAREKKADLLVISSPERRSNMFDRIFTNNTEYIFQELPTNILIVKRT